MKYFFIIIFNICLFSQTQYEMNQTAKREYLEANNKLDSIHKEIENLYSTDSLFISKFRESISIWEKYRDIMIEARFPENDKTGVYGSIFPLCYYTNLKELTDRRIDEIMIWLKGIDEGEACSGSLNFRNGISK